MLFSGFLLLASLMPIFTDDFVKEAEPPPPRVSVALADGRPVRLQGVRGGAPSSAKRAIEVSQNPDEEAPPEFRDRPIRLPPFIWLEKDKERDSEFFMLMMLLWRADNPDRSYTTFFPFFYSRFNKTTKARTIASPAFYYYHSPASTALYGLFVYAEFGPKVSRVGVPPIFWYGRTTQQLEGRSITETTSYLFPIYFYDEREGRRVLATPLGGGWGTRNDFQGLIALYYWRNTHTENIDLDAHVFFPLFWHVKTPRWETFAGGPVFYRRRDTRRGGEKRAYGVLPVFYRRTSPGGGSTTVTPLSIFERRDPQHSYLVTPLGGYAVAPGKATVMVGPYLSSYDHGRRFSAFLPIFFHGSGPRGEGQGRWSWTVLGTYYERKTTSSEGKAVSVDRALLPLFYYGREGHDVRFVSPVAFFHRYEDGRFLGLLGPVYHSRSEDHKTWVLMPGLAWYHTGPRFSKTFGLLPFYYAQKREDSETYAGLVPLFFFHNVVRQENGKDARRRTLALLPLFYFREKPGDVTFLSLPYVQIRQGEERRIMAGWLWWDHRGEDHRNLTFFPFFHWERLRDQRTLYTLVGGYEAGKGYHRSLWGPVYKRRDAELGIKDDVVFPLYWNLNRPESRFFLAGPYFRSKQGAVLTEGILPVWFHSSYPGAAQTIVFPLLYVRVDKVEKTRTIFTPLGGLWTQKDPSAYKLLAPLVFQAHGPHKRTTVVFPIFWYDYDHKKQTIVIPPFFTRRDERNGLLDVALLPAFFYHRQPGTTLLLSPGVFYVRDENNRATTVLPLLYYWHRTKGHSSGIAGPWIWSKDRVYDEKGNPRNFVAGDDFLRVLVPIFLHRRSGKNQLFVSPVAIWSQWGLRTVTVLPGFGFATRRDKEGEVVSRAGFLAPIYFRKAKEAGDLVVFPFFWHTHGHRRSETALAPLFYLQTQPDGFKFLTLGAGLGKYENRTWVWIANFFYDKNADTTRAFLLPVVYLEKSPRRSVIGTPLFYHRADYESHRTVTVAPLFYRATSPDRSTWVLYPLAWRDEDKNQDVVRAGFLPFAFWGRRGERSWVAAPLLLSFYQREGKDHLGVYGGLIIDSERNGARTVALIPVFRYHRDEFASSFASLPFIWWLKRDGHTRAFVGLGYWNTETGTRVFPLYARWQSKDEDGTLKRSTTIVPLLYVRYTTPTRDIAVVPPALYFRVKRADGSKVQGVGIFWSEEIKPARIVDGRAMPSEHSWDVLGGFAFGYDRIGRHRRFTYLYGLHFNLKSLPAKKKAQLQGPAVTLRREENGAWGRAEAEMPLASL